MSRLRHFGIFNTGFIDCSGFRKHGTIPIILNKRGVGPQGVKIDEYRNSRPY